MKFDVAYRRAPNCSESLQSTCDYIHVYTHVNSPYCAPVRECCLKRKQLQRFDKCCTIEIEPGDEGGIFTTTIVIEATRSAVKLITSNADIVTYPTHIYVATEFQKYANKVLWK